MHDDSRERSKAPLTIETGLVASFEGVISKTLDNCPDIVHGELIQTVWRAFSPQQRDQLLSHFIDREIEHQKRSRVHRLERKIVVNSPAIRRRETLRQRTLPDETILSFGKRVFQIFQNYESDLKVKFTAELLASQFSLGKGVKVTWGNATIAEHEIRMELLSKHIQGTGETYALHADAVSQLKENGATCLNELTQEE